MGQMMKVHGSTLHLEFLSLRAAFFFLITSLEPPLNFLITSDPPFLWTHAPFMPSSFPFGVFALIWTNKSPCFVLCRRSCCFFFF